MLRFVGVVLTVAFFASSLLADQPASQPTSQPATAPSPEEIAEQLHLLAEAIRQAKTPPEAVAAYVEANKLLRGDVQANEAYMRKMLTFGEVTKAVIGARWLVHSDKDHGLAWGVIAYVDAGRGSLAKALAEIVQAAALLGDDPGVMHNAGVLAAWSEASGPAANIPTRLRKTISRSIDKWLENSAFAEAYQDLLDDLTDHDERIEEAQDAVDEIAEEMDRVKEDGENVQDQIDAIDEELASLQSELYNVTAELAAHEAARHVINRRIARKKQQIRSLARKNPLTPQDKQSLARLRAGLAALISRADRAGDASIEWDLRERINELRDEIRAAKRERRNVWTQLRKLQGQFGKLKTSKRKASADVRLVVAQEAKFLRGLHRHVEWQLPLVEGQRIDLEAARAAVREERSSHPVTIEKDPAKVLQLAGHYIQAGLTDRAIELLQEVVQMAPGSDAAIEAQAMLDEMTAEASVADGDD
ncbi:hypothetical protein LCGC14_0269200 [marine sediment metagenome]|uniref:Tetratricopeptide repeat protein n=1 Tax=marine sediment metagenome TaxID=412755 RepID=A0A0F9WK52_9ZZZZ|nr:hypothetical protein [Phycisphaerae bacterium]HDZ44226.1 hypothetical protein [Phycisphaerae bacterium]